MSDLVLPGWLIWVFVAIGAVQSYALGRSAWLDVRQLRDERRLRRAGGEQHG